MECELCSDSIVDGEGIACSICLAGLEQDREELTVLRAEIAELRKDRERLDGMIKHHLACERTLPGWYRVSKLHEDSYAVERESAPTPREAIDAAIKAAEGEGGAK